MDATLFVVFFILMKSLHAAPAGAPAKLISGNDQHMLKDDVEELKKIVDDQALEIATLREKGTGLQQGIIDYVEGLKERLNQTDTEILNLATSNAGDQQALKDQVAKLEEKFNQQATAMATLKANVPKIDAIKSMVADEISKESGRMAVSMATMVNHIHSESGQAWLGWSTGRTGVLINKYIAFTKTYTSPPHVILSIDTFDVSNVRPIRVHLRAEDVTKTGFLLKMRTWSKTEWYQARVTWLAVTDN